MSSSSSEVCNILDLPDEILVEIILHFDAKERLALADSCRRLNDLVFEDQALLRDLDFSRKAHLTTAADIQRYFSKEATRQFAITVNIQNIEFIDPEHMLNNSIGRAINLVDVNIFGITFENLERLGSFLAPLLHLKRLSLDWPKSDNDDFNINRGILQKPFSRLTYLSLVMHSACHVLPPIVKLCLELEELRMSTQPLICSSSLLSRSEPIKLKNLKIVQLREISSTSLKEDLMANVPDRAEWTDFHLPQPGDAYFERNVKLCDQLSHVKLPRPWASRYPRMYFEMRLNLVFDQLLEAAIIITHEDVRKKICCLTNAHGKSCMLKIEEAKELLKDPGYQVSYLEFNHAIEHDCDAHLVASAFPNVTELVFHVINSKSPRGESRNRLKRRLRKKGSTASKEDDYTTNPESSFKMLIENTPHVKTLTICTNDYLDLPECADLDSLHLIPGWKNLRVIIFIEIQFGNGNFLIDIGKECQELQEVQIWYPDPEPSNYIYGICLVQMLNHCRNLRKFSINQPKIDNMTELFKALSNKRNLETVRVLTDTKEYDSLELISSIEQMLHRCPDLTKFIIVVSREMKWVDTKLRLYLKNIVAKWNRPKFVFLGPDPNYDEKADWEDASTSFFSNSLDGDRFPFPRNDK